MSDDNVIALSVENISKAYRIWRDPASRLKFPLFQALESAIPQAFQPKALRRRIGEHSETAYYKDFYALQDVNFTVRKGSAVGLIGMNGSGKSTLLQILAGTLTPTTGHVHIHGRVAALLELGSGFNPEFTGRENIYLNCSILGLPKAEIDARLEDIIAFSEIEAFIDQPVKTYSSGMTVRLAFSAISQVDPDILIIDEALAVGDAYFQHKCVRRILAFLENGGTLLFVSHDPGAVKSICDRAILLDRGRVVQDGPPEAVLDYYNALIATKENDAKIAQVRLASGRVATRAGNRKARILDIAIMDAHGQPAQTFAFGAEAIVTCTVAFDDEIKAPTFGILIRDRLGADIFGTNTHHMGQPLHDAMAGSTQKVSARLCLNLGAGSYSVTVALHTGAEHLSDNFDWMDNAAVMQILPRVEQTFIGCAALPCAFESQNLKQVL
jgi:lipopolysaccharide transport system ATP-binding protein